MVHPLTTVTRVRPLDGGGYRVDARWTKAKLSRRTATQTFTAEQVVFAAAALGTQKLLHRLKAEGDLPRLSRPARPPHPHQLRVDPRRDRARTSRPTTARASRSPRRSTPTSTPTSSRCATARAATPCRCMQTVLTDGDGPRAALADLAAGDVEAEAPGALDLYDFKHWSERTVIALVMQTLDNSITTFREEGPVSAGVMTSRQGHGEPNPTWIPAANEAVRRMAERHGRHPRRHRSASRSTCR